MKIDPPEPPKPPAIDVDRLFLRFDEVDACLRAFGDTYHRNPNAVDSAREALQALPDDIVQGLRFAAMAFVELTDQRLSQGSV